MNLYFFLLLSIPLFPCVAKADFSGSYEGSGSLITNFYVEECPTVQFEIRQTGQHFVIENGKVICGGKGSSWEGITLEIQNGDELHLKGGNVGILGNHFFNIESGLSYQAFLEHNVISFVSANAGTGQGRMTKVLRAILRR